jgi:hypothetical protein
MLEIIDEIRPRKQERMSFREIVSYLIGVVSILLLVTLATNAYATDIPVQVLEKDGITIRLMNKPCVEPVSVAMIVPSMLGRFKAIESVWPEKDGSKKAYAGCWAHLTPPEALEEGYLVVFSDGQSGFIPKSEFKKMRGQVGV